jgi:DtxR family Mn-dependent transcriptional regulator
VTTLLWLFVAALLGAAFLAPNKGVLARWRHHRAALGREQAENALKHLLGQAAAGESASLSSLQGILRTSDRELLALTERLGREGLIRTEGDRFRLTSAGERAALHVVRAHRIWELYLADELGVPVGKVHAQAERAEHLLTPADVDRLSAAMGHPEVDPHGDPIPERDGELRPPGGTPLSAWPVAAPARIVHLEDEPPLAYAQIAALGLRLGQLVHIVEASPTRIVLSDGEGEFTLAPMLAGNVYVAAAVATAARISDSVVRLSDLPSGTVGEVVSLDPGCRGFIRRRLLDLGFTPGAQVRPDLTTFAGDPRAYRLRGTTIALRREQSERVLVRAVA